MDDEGSQFTKFFGEATGFEEPFPYQSRLALDHRAQSTLMDISTGLGKTEAALAAWLWNRVVRRDPAWPRRLVYCLPMRVLVEQTRDRAVLALRRLGLLAGEAIVRDERGKEVVGSYAANVRDERPPEGWFRDQAADGRRIPVVTLMGGEDKEDWDIYPEREAVIVGTQDMLLSRALNRGYAMSRARWPMQFGLLNTDCLWVFDEIQLMGAGLATTSQLEAFRSLWGTKDDHGCRSVWMSATLQRDWLETIDFKPVSLGQPRGLEKDDLINDEVKRRFEAKKPLEKAEAVMGESDDLAKEIVAAHEMHKGLTLIVVNTVARACDLYSAIKSLQTGPETGKAARRKRTGQRPTLDPDVRLVLLHSRFRPRDRAARIQELLAEPPIDGTICVSTQVVEAGVDVSATTLFTELAPWASLVQRFGRCNRRGTENDKARVFLILPAEKVADVAPPYESDQLAKARALLEKCKNGVGPATLDQVRKQHAADFSEAMRFEHGQVIRLHEFIDLFSTEPDLAGGFTDISPFVRDSDRDVDVRVFWRSMPDHRPSPDSSEPSGDELCAVPCTSLQEFLGNRDAWEWSEDAERWERLRTSDVRPGMILMLDTAFGGYDDERGWTGEPGQVTVLDRSDGGVPEGLTDDRQSFGPRWQTIEDHSAKVEKRATALAKALSLDGPVGNALIMAARWHDVGKGHHKWQSAARKFTGRLLDTFDGKNFFEIPALDDLRKTLRNPPEPPALIGKFPSAWDVSLRRLQDGQREAFARLRRRQFRPGLRHEAASALAAMDAWRNGQSGLSALAVYLVAAHHGKVRTVLRSRAANGSDVFGVRDGDQLPGAFPLPSAVSLSTAAKAIGAVGEWADDGSFEVASPSWADMIAALCGPMPGDPDTSDVVGASEPRALGPYILAYLEVILRAADARAEEEVSP